MKDKSWFIYHEVEHLGPFSLQEIVSRVQSGEISADRLIWREGEPSWVEVRNHPEYRNITHGETETSQQEDLPPLPPVPEEEELPPLPQEALVVEEQEVLIESEVILFSDEGLASSEDESEAEPPITYDEVKIQDTPKEVPEKEKLEQVPTEQASDESWVPEAPISTSVDKEEKKRSKLPLVLSLVLIVAGATGAGLWWFKGTTNFSVSLPKVEKAEKKNIDKVINAPTDQSRYKIAFSEDGEEIIFATNIKEDALLRLTMYSVKGRTLHDGRITVVSSAHLKSGKGVFKKLIFKRGKKLYHGEYAFKVEGYLINSKKGIEGLIPFEMKPEQIRELRSHGKDFEYRDTELFFPSTKKAFEVQLQKYRAKTSKLQKPLLDRKERYNTYMHFLEKVGTLYRDEIKTIQSGRKIIHFENEYNKDIGPYLRDLIIDSNKVHVSLVNFNPEESQAYDQLTQFGKEIGSLAADFVKKTESLKGITEQKRGELLEQFNQNYEDVRMMGKEALDDIQYELSGQTLNF